jgi:hypothetical protein
VKYILIAVVMTYTLLLHERGFGANFENEYRCNAEIIAEFSPKITRDEWLETIDALSDSNAIDKKYAAELRLLVFEAYDVSDLAGWVEHTCKKSKS